MDKLGYAYQLNDEI